MTTRLRASGAAACLLALPFLGAGCASDTQTGPAPAYELQLASAPGDVVPERPATLMVVLDVAETPEVGATVSATLVHEDHTMDLGVLRDEGDGTYAADDVMIPAAGEWHVDVSVEGSLGPEAMTASLTVACDHGGAAGAGCCTSSDCGGGLFCVMATCQADLAAVDDACYTDAECATGACRDGACARTVAVLGDGAHTMDAVEMTVIGTSADDLTFPRDVAVNPEEPGHVWVVSNETNTTTVFFWPGTESQSSQSYNSFGSDHFMASPAGLAFGEPGVVATIQDTDELTQGPPPFGTPEDFMGPALFSSNLKDYDAGHASHLDMLHNSPLGVGIAWEQARIFWVFDGYHSSLTRYDFGDDHGLGGADHSDGKLWRYAEGEVKRVDGVSSHMEFDPETGVLYAVDTGNNRIVALDPSTATATGNIFPNYDGTVQLKMDGGTLTTLVDGAEVGMELPSGLAFEGDLAFVTDNATGRIWAFDRTSWQAIDYLDTGLPAGALMGLDVGVVGELYLVDAVGDRLLRIDAK